MIQKGANYCPLETAKTEAAKFQGATRCIIYSDCGFSMYKDGKTLFVRAPKALDNY